MIRRLFWLAMGVTIGALIVRKLSRAAEKLTPKGIADRLGAGLAELSASLRDFAADVREAMTEQEAVLRDAAGLDGSANRPAATARDAIDRT